MRSLANSSARASPSAPSGAEPRLHIEPGDGLVCPPSLALLLHPIAAAVASAAGLSGTVALRLTDDEDMSRLNETFAGKAAPTDVLAFPSDDPLHPGDVAISLERVKSQAAAFGHSVEREFGYLLTHALLHLAGLSHDDDGRQCEMRRMEESVMAVVGLVRARPPRA